MPVSRLDVIYRRVLLSKFFTKGWGDPDHIYKLLTYRGIVSNRESCYKLVDKDYPIEILKEETWGDCHVTEGCFLTPFALQLPDVVNPEIRNAYFQMVLPRTWKSDSHKPVCIHFAGTGDHYFWKRRNLMVKPLLKHGIGSIILENPYYGLRKPKSQLYSCLPYVSDIFVMGGCLVLEGLVLLHMCEKMGFGPLGVTGLSMGGHMASLAATAWPKPLVLVPCLSWSTASSVFTEGVMSNAIDWDYLQKQYFSDSTYFKTLSKMCKIVDDPTQSGLAQMPEFVNDLTDFRAKFSKRTITPHEILEFLGSEDIDASFYSDYTSQNMISSKDVRLLNVNIKALFTKFIHDSYSMKLRDKHAIWFMRGLMDECTHLKNFSVPVDTSLIISLCAKSDAYVPREGCTNLADIWPGADVKYLNCGHVSAYLKYLDVFRKSIVEAFERAKKVTQYSSIRLG